ncbi:hypothetical protein QFZ82_006614 [Streptomyces sp. V4I23]|nr:hypothetical protein [Streptomyces sp. V4I23]
MGDVHDELLGRLRAHQEVRALAPSRDRSVREGKLTSALAAELILEAFGRP